MDLQKLQKSFLKLIKPLADPKLIMSACVVIFSLAFMTDWQLREYCGIPWFLILFVLFTFGFPMIFLGFLGRAINGFKRGSFYLPGEKELTGNIGFLVSLFIVPVTVLVLGFLYWYLSHYFTPDGCPPIDLLKDLWYHGGPV